MSVVIVRSGSTSLGNNCLDFVIFVALALSDTKIVVILSEVPKNSIEGSNDINGGFHFLLLHDIVDSLFPM